jgi:hypothetical protein
MAFVMIRSSEGDIFKVDLSIARMSPVISCMVDDSGTDDEIPLPTVKTATLSRVLDYCAELHRDRAYTGHREPLCHLCHAFCHAGEFRELEWAAKLLDIRRISNALTCTLKNRNGKLLSSGPTPDMVIRRSKLVSGVCCSDKELVLAAVQQDGLAIKYASSSLRSDREIVTAAVLTSGFAVLEYTPSLANDSEIVLAASKKRCRAHIQQALWQRKASPETQRSKPRLQKKRPSKSKQQKGGQGQVYAWATRVQDPFT